MTILFTTMSLTLLQMYRNSQKNFCHFQTINTVFQVMTYNGAYSAILAVCTKAYTETQSKKVLAPDRAGIYHLIMGKNYSVFTDACL